MSETPRPATPRRVLVCGGRHYSDVVRLYAELDRINEVEGIAVIIEGSSSGADSLAAAWAGARHVPLKHFSPDWATYGRAAGPIRNAAMLREGRPDLVVAFPGGRGTADMTRQAQQAGIELREVTHE